MREEGYTILEGTDKSPFYKCGGVTVRPDIVCKKGDRMFIYEIKRCVHSHRLWTSIDQLTFHQFTNKRKRYNYVVAFPKKFRDKPQFNHKFREYLDKKLKLKIRFF